MNAVRSLIGDLSNFQYFQFRADRRSFAAMHPRGELLFHKGITLLGAGVLAAGVIAAPVAASATGSTVTSAITGHIEGSDGADFAAGTPVVVWSTPSEDALAAAKVGDSFVDTPIASGVVGSAGAFSVPINDVSSLSKYASNDGVLNLEVRAADGTDIAPFALSRKIVTVDGTAALVDPSDLSNSKATTAAAALVAAANKPSTIAATKVTKSIARKTSRMMSAASDELPVDPQDPSMDPTDGPPDTDETPEPTSTATATGAPGPVGGGPDNRSSTQVCGTDYLQDFGARKVIVGSSYANAASTTGTFTYSSGASSSISVAYSVSGSKGSYSKGGTTSISSKGAVGFGTRSGAYSYATYFKFGKYGDYCYDVGSKKNADSYYSFKVRPSSYAGGGTVNSSTTPTATKCTTFSGGGTTITRSSSSANTWTSGADLNAVIGINLSSKTGYTSTAKLSYKNNGSSKKICGTNDYFANSQRSVTK